MKPSVNLLPKYERYSNLTYYIFIFGLIIFIGLASVLIYLFFNEKNILLNQESQIHMLTEQRKALESKLSSETDFDTSTHSDAIAFAESHAVPVSTLVDELVMLLPDDSYLVDYRYDYHTVTIETQFETMTDTANYMELLTNSRFVADAKVDLINTEESDIGKMDSESELVTNYEVIPRYQATYTMNVNQQELLEEEEDD